MINFCIQTISYNSVINTFLAFYKVYLLLRERTDYVTPYVTVIIIGKCFVKGLFCVVILGLKNVNLNNLSL